VTISKRTGKPIAMCPGCGYAKKACQCKELALLQQIRAVGLPEPIREFVFLPGRKYRADFAYPDVRLLIEVEGGVYGTGGHSTGRGITRDIEKGNAAVLEGYRVIRCSGEHVTSGQCLTWIEHALEWEQAS